MDLKRRYSVRGETVYTEAQVQERIRIALLAQGPKEISPRAAYQMTLEQLGITQLNSKSTPSSVWYTEGKEDFHPDLINKERGSLMLGNHTDDQLANEVFLYGNPSDSEKHKRLLSGEIMDIAYLTAAKERIRWLSRHLELALKHNTELAETVKELQYEIRELDSLG